MLTDPDVIKAPGPPFVPTVMFPDDKFVRVPHVALLDEHSSEDTRGGKPIDVTADVLRETAKNNQERYDTTGDATPYVIGHTRDGKPESEQPDILGYFVNFSVDPFFNTGRKALFADLYLHRDKLTVARKYPRRSVEYWRSRKQIDPVSALSASSPERDLGLLLFARADEIPYHYSIPSTPILTEVSPMADDKTAAIDAAQEKETSTAKSDDARLNMLEEKVNQIAQFMSMLEEMLQGEHGDDKDLLAPADGDDADTEDDDEEPEPKPTSKKKEPVKMDAYAGAGNDFVPSTTDEGKKKMSRDENTVTLDKEQYAKLIAATEQIQRDHDDMLLRYNRSRAEQAVADLEAGASRIDFGTNEEREEEVKLLTSLLQQDRSGNSFSLQSDRIAKKYKRKPEQTPDSAGVERAMRFARTDNSNGPVLKSTEDVIAFTNAKIANPSLTLEDWKNSKR